MAELRVLLGASYSTPRTLPPWPFGGEETKNDFMALQQSKHVCPCGCGCGCVKGDDWGFVLLRSGNDDVLKSLVLSFLFFLSVFLSLQ